MVGSDDGTSRTIHHAPSTINSTVVAIDASRAAEEQKTGVGWYAYHCIAHLRTIIPHDVRVLLYADRPLPKEWCPLPRHWEARVLNWSLVIGHRSFRPQFWSQVRLAAQVLHDRPDALFVPAHVLPDITAQLRRCGVRRPKLVTTIHDVAFREIPRAYPPRERAYAHHATRVACASADRIIVPTCAVAGDLLRHYRCDVDRIAVIPHGVIPPASEPLEMRNASLEIPQPFFLYLGRLEYKKNVVRMVEAFGRIARDDASVRFFLAGPPGAGYAEVRVAIDASPARDRIIELGWVDATTRDTLLAHAHAFCFPTLAEGFGLPILEAMAAGTPVLTSDGHAHAEVAGDAALLVDPIDVADIARGMRQLLADARLRDALVHKGEQRAATFTWDRTARETWNAISRVLSA